MIFFFCISPDRKLLLVQVPIKNAWYGLYICTTSHEEILEGYNDTEQAYSGKFFWELWHTSDTLTFV